MAEDCEEAEASKDIGAHKVVSVVCCPTAVHTVAFVS